MSQPLNSVPYKLIRVIKSLYDISMSKVKKGSVTTGRFNIETGVRQGDGLSPLLFIMLMYNCIRETSLGKY